MKLHSLQDENVFESRKAFCPPGGVRTESSSPPRAATTLLSLPTTLQLECRGVTPEKNASLTNYASLGIPWYANTLPLLLLYAFRRIAHYSTPCYFAIRSSHLRDASFLPVVQSHDLQKLESLPSIVITKNSNLTTVFFFFSNSSPSPSFWRFTGNWNAHTSRRTNPPTLYSSSRSFDERRGTVEGGEGRNTICYLRDIDWQVRCKALGVDWGR